MYTPKDTESEKKVQENSAIRRNNTHWIMYTVTKFKPEKPHVKQSSNDIQYTFYVYTVKYIFKVDKAMNNDTAIFTPFKLCPISTNTIKLKLRAILVSIMLELQKLGPPLTHYLLASHKKVHKQTVQSQIRRHRTWRIIRVYTFCEEQNRRKNCFIFKSILSTYADCIE